jgi:hypothetical protein
MVLSQLGSRRAATREQDLAASSHWGRRFALQQVAEQLQRPHSDALRRQPTLQQTSCDASAMLGCRATAMASGSQVTMPSTGLCSRCRAMLAAAVPAGAGRRRRGVGAHGCAGGVLGC